MVKQHSYEAMQLTIHCAKCRGTHGLGRKHREMLADARRTERRKELAARKR